MSAEATEPNAESLVPALEAILFSAPEPLSSRALAAAFQGKIPANTLEDALKLLQARCEQPGRGIQLIEVAGGWQFRTREEYFPWVQGVARVEREERISPAAIETLAVVAYKQPATRAEIDAIRGAASANHLRSLMDRGLVRVTGRADVPGAPFQYGTTRQFLKHFGLESVKDLPDPKDLQRLLMEQGRGGAPEQA
jgi:segregation and condensation protein B